MHSTHSRMRLSLRAEGSPLSAQRRALVAREGVRPVFYSECIGRLLPALENGNENKNANIGVILDSLRTCFVKVDHEYMIVEVNRTALEWLAAKKRDVIGKHFQHVFNRSRMGMIRNAVEDTIFTDREMRSAHRPDRLIDLHTYPVSDGAIVFFKDITEERRTEFTARRAQAFLQSSLNMLSAAVAVFDKAGAVVISNAAWKRFAVARGLADLGDAYRCGAHLAHADPLARRETTAVAEALASILDGRQTRVRLTHLWRRAGTVRWHQLGAASFECAGETYVIAIDEDVTTVKEAQHMLGEMSQRLLAAQEKERQQIAEDLHDSTAQHLVAIGLNVMGLKAEVVPAGKAVDLLRDIEQSLDEASKELRAFTYLLYPPELEQQGLSMMIKSYVTGFGKRTGIEVQLRVSAVVDALPMAMQRSVLRVMQEALANVHRHAAASRVGVGLRLIRQKLHVIVSDNGRGVEGAAGRATRRCRPACLGVGVPSMRARLREFGGDLELLSGREGTRLHAVMPVSAGMTVGRALDAEEGAARGRGQISRMKTTAED